MSSSGSILVTGSSGFVGSALVRSLRQASKREVIGVDLVASDTTTVIEDFASPNMKKLIPEGSTIIHLGGVSTDGLAREQPLLATEANISGTVRLALSGAEAGAEHFIFASSEWVYGEHRDRKLLEEETPLDVSSLGSIYAQTKLIGEALLKSIGGYRNLTILRFAIVYGPRTVSGSAPEKIFADCSKKVDISVGSPDTARKFIFIDDLIAGIRASLDSRGRNTFNLAGPELYSLRDIYEISCEISRKRPAFTFNSEAVASIRNVSAVRASEALKWSSETTMAGGLEQIARLERGV